MPAYSLYLKGLPEGQNWVKSHDFPDVVNTGDDISYNGRTWWVLEVFTIPEENLVEGEPPEHLLCTPA